MRFLEASFDVMEQPDLLQWLQSAKKSGVLRVASGATVRRIYFKDGGIVACMSNEPRLLLGLGDIARDSVPALKLNKFTFTGATEF